MAKLKVYGIVDLKTGIYDRPQFAHTQLAFLRMWEETVNEDGPQATMIARHPEDFQVYEIAEWDDVKGEITPLPVPISLGKASEYKRKPAHQDALPLASVSGLPRSNS